MYSIRIIQFLHTGSYRLQMMVVFQVVKNSMNKYTYFCVTHVFLCVYYIFDCYNEFLLTGLK